MFSRKTNRGYEFKYYRCPNLEWISHSIVGLALGIAASLISQEVQAEDIRTGTQFRLPENAFFSGDSSETGAHAFQTDYYTSTFYGDSSRYCLVHFRRFLPPTYTTNQPLTVTRAEASQNNSLVGRLWVGLRRETRHHINLQVHHPDIDWIDCVRNQLHGTAGQAWSVQDILDTVSCQNMTGQGPARDCRLNAQDYRRHWEGYIRSLLELNPSMRNEPYYQNLHLGAPTSAQSNRTNKGATPSNDHQDNSNGGGSNTAAPALPTH